MLNILEYFPLQKGSKVAWMHYIIEAMRLAYSQREQYLGDPGFVNVPVDKLISKKNAQVLSRLIHKYKTIQSPQLKPFTDKVRQNQTTHFSIMDREGNLVSATLSINYVFWLLFCS